jgi:hypothetical protein
MDRVHFSNLKHFSRSPLHYLHSLTARYESRPMRVGSVVHALVLGGEFHHYDGERRGKAWQEFKATHEGLIVTTSELDDAKAIAEAVTYDPVASGLLAGPRETEVPLEWEYLGRACAGRLDLVKPDLLGELKVSNSSQPDRFSRQALWMGYPEQLAWYLRALRRPLTSRAVIIAVEDKPPHPVTCFEVTQRALEAGDKRCRIWMEQLLCCEAARHFPGYVQSVVPLDVPDAEEFSLVVEGEECEL